ncbi:Trehalose synthase [uncultured archaeon]|nr:Trehalose synthase [uncultured archaeon]
MKVLVLTTTFPRWKGDSTPAFVYELSKRLRNEGLEIVVLAPHYEGAKFYEEMEGLKVYRFPYFYPTKYQRLCYGGGILSNLKRSKLTRIQSPLLFLSELYYAIRIINEEKIDIVHSHWIPNGLVGAFCKKILNKPLIVSVHGSDLIFLNNGFLKYLGLFILKNCDLCSVNSTATRDSVISKKIVKKLKIIPMGVDLNLFNPDTVSKINKTPITDDLVILTVGRLSEEKGIKFLIEAMPAILKDIPAVKLMIVGDGPERKNLEQIVKRYDLTNVIFVGTVLNEDMNKFYKKADVFVLPSLREGLGVVLLEAMACGIPVIGSNIGGITDIIRNKENGLLVEPENPKDIADKIIMLLSEEKLKQKFSKNGLETVKEKFSWDVVINRFVEVYNSLFISYYLHKCSSNMSDSS